MEADRNEVYHIADIPMAFCKECHCWTEHVFTDAPECHLEGYVCRVCDSISFNYYSEMRYSAEERV